MTQVSAGIMKLPPSPQVSLDTQEVEKGTLECCYRNSLLSIIFLVGRGDKEGEDKKKHPKEPSFHVYLPNLDGTHIAFYTSVVKDAGKYIF